MFILILHLSIILLPPRFRLNDHLSLSWFLVSPVYSTMRPFFLYARLQYAIFVTRKIVKWKSKLLQRVWDICFLEKVWELALHWKNNISYFVSDIEMKWTCSHHLTGNGKRWMSPYPAPVWLGLLVLVAMSFYLQKQLAPWRYIHVTNPSHRYMTSKEKRNLPHAAEDLIVLAPRPVGTQHCFTHEAL